MAAALSLPAPCVVRIGKPDDLAFVVDSWTKHAHRGQRMRTATTHVRSLLARDGATLIVAHVPGEPDAILGWAVLEAAARLVPVCVHYVYVRSAARRTGVAREMLGELAGQAIEYSSATPGNVVPPRGWVLNVGRART